MDGDWLIQESSSELAASSLRARPRSITVNAAATNIVAHRFTRSDNTLTPPHWSTAASAPVGKAYQIHPVTLTHPSFISLFDGSGHPTHSQRAHEHTQRRGSTPLHSCAQLANSNRERADASVNGCMCEQIGVLKDRCVVTVTVTHFNNFKSNICSHVPFFRFSSSH